MHTDAGSSHVLCYKEIKCENHVEFIGNCLTIFQGDGREISHGNFAMAHDHFPLALHARLFVDFFFRR